MDESPVVRKGGSRKTVKWLGLAVGVALAAGIGWRLATHGIGATSKVAALPAAEQNALIFDEAVRLLKQNYYDPKLLDVPEWPAFVALWRKRALESKPGPWLYVNVLGNFATQFPNSHVAFMTPATPPSPTPAGNSTASTQSARLIGLIMSGPGFDSTTVRRGNRTQLVVADVLPGSPAARAGVSPGWAMKSWSFTTHSDSVRFKGVFLPVAHDMVREADRTAAAAADATPIEFDYEALPLRTDFETRKLRNGSTYLRFDNFNDWGFTSRVLDVIDAAGPEGLVLDLRRNAGGRSLNMMRVLGRLLGHGVVVGETRAGGSSTPLESLLFGDAHYRGPLMVLIGPSTMSAGEIAAAAVQDRKRGVLIGRTTNGAVLSSRKFDLPDGGTVMIPTQDFVRPGDRRIEGVGVEPDVWILPTLEDVRAGRDPVLERAIQEMQDDSKSAP
jgi:carboxyl-terminal processing protease